MDFTVREMTEEDLKPGSGLYETLSNLTQAPPIPFDQGKLFFATMKAQGKIVFVALDNATGQIVGHVSLMLEQKLLREGAVCGHVEDVATRTGYEGKGIATALMRTLMARAQHEHCYKVILDCSVENASFYEKFGFSKNDLCMRFPEKKRNR